MEKQLYCSNKNESKDAKGPRQRNGIRADIRLEGKSCDVEPQTRDRHDRDTVNRDHPWRKPAGFDSAATAELDDENKGQN